MDGTQVYPAMLEGNPARRVSQLQWMSDLPLAGKGHPHCAVAHSSHLRIYRRWYPPGLTAALGGVGVEAAMRSC